MKLKISIFIILFLICINIFFSYNNIYTQDIIPVTIDLETQQNSIEDIISTIEEISKIPPDERSAEEWQSLVNALIDLGKLQTNDISLMVEQLSIKIEKYNDLLDEYEKNIKVQENKLEQIDLLYEQALLYNQETKKIISDYNKLITEYKTRKNLIGFGLGYGYNNTAHIDISYYNTLWSFFMIGGGLWLDYDITNNNTSFGVKINLGIHF